jgi:hypothetical protein
LAITCGIEIASSASGLKNCPVIESASYSSGMSCGRTSADPEPLPGCGVVGPSDPLGPQPEARRAATEKERTTLESFRTWVPLLLSPGRAGMPRNELTTEGTG